MISLDEMVWRLKQLRVPKVGVRVGIYVGLCCLSCPLLVSKSPPVPQLHGQEFVLCLLLLVWSYDSIEQDGWSE